MTPPSAPTVDPATAGPGHDRYEIQGRAVTLPCHVAHARAALGLFTADADEVAADLPTGLSPVLTRPGRTLVALMAVRYVDNPLGDYDEGVVASIVRPSTDPSPAASLRDVLAGRYGIFVHHMPVSQAFTREAGERIWGFPKTLDHLDLRLSDRRVGLRWSVDQPAQQDLAPDHDEDAVLELVMPRGGRLPVPPQSSVAHTLPDGVVWRTPLTMHGSGLAVRPGGARVRLGTHPIADDLRRWGVGPRGVASAWVEHATMDFRAAAPLR